MNYLGLNSILSMLMGYLDPGSGSLIIQLLIAVFVGAGIFFRARWEKIKKLFGGKSSESEEDQIEDGDFDV